VRLVGESHVRRDRRQAVAALDSRAREVEAPHHQVAVRARAEADSELAREVVAREAGDRLDLRGVDDARPLGVQELACALDGRDVDAP